MFPTRRVEKTEDFDRILDERLEKLQTRTIDFCILDTITFNSRPLPMSRARLFDCIEKAKAAGKIRHVGFSFHASLPVFKQEVDKTPHWDFCQMQLNYLDTEYEAGLLGLKYASDRGLGVSIVQPLRAGFLADTPPEVQDIFNQASRKRSPVEWAFDYLWDMPEVGITLSGMNEMEHFVKNIEYAKRSSIGMLDAEDKALIARVVKQYGGYGSIPCTGCGYCQPCPNGIAIVQNIMIYNQYKIRGNRYAQRYYGMNEAYGLKAESCIGCDMCRSKCPAGIHISEAMKTIRNTFDA